MAHNLHLIYSDTIKGGAFYEGGSYGTFFSDPEHSMEVWKDKIPEAEKNGWIDPTKNLEGHPVMIISGADDQVLRPPVQKQLKDLYTKYKAEVSYELVPELSHTWPVLSADPDRYPKVAKCD